MRKITSILFCLFAFTACSLNSAEPFTNSGGMVSTTPTNTNTNLPQRKYLALGDSYTIGQNVDEKDRWSVQLIDLLKNDFSFSKHDIIARTGWTTEELTEAIEKQNVTEQYDMVSLLIGVNNQYRGQSVEKYRTEFRNLLNVSIKFAKNQPKKVFVLSIPDWGKSPFAKGQDYKQIASDIDTFNNIAKAECKQLSIVFIDVTELSRNNLDADFFASDKLHYSGKMHLLWAREALTTAKVILR
jgi:lysophospholipase L1-like esterase